MKKVLIGVLTLFSLSAQSAELNQAEYAQLSAALQHANRPAEDKARDTDRKPAELLKFYGVKPGMNVADMMTGGGYYAEILSRYLGADAKVYAQNNSIALQRFASRAMDKRLNGRDLNNVIRLDTELEQPGFPKGEMDVVMMGLFYHDSYWMKADRKKMNQAIFDALKPGGVFALWDHRAEAGSGDRDVQLLHRVDEEMVKKEVLAAGFVLEASSELLANSDDDHTINVFRPEIRGKTDRFMFLFRKPGK